MTTKKTITRTLFAIPAACLFAIVYAAPAWGEPPSDRPSAPVPSQPGARAEDPSDAAKTFGGHTQPSYTIAGGGSTFLTGGTFRLAGTSGQAYANDLVGGSFGLRGEIVEQQLLSYRVRGGFWPASASADGVPQAPLVGDDVCINGSRNGQPCGGHAECPGGACQLKNRFITAVIPETATAHGIKVHVVSIDPNSVATLSDYNGTDRWVGVSSVNVSDGTSPSFNAARLQCAFASQNWNALLASTMGGMRLHIYGDIVVPSSFYEVSTCSPQANCSPALSIGTAKFGDIIAPLNVTNFQDIVAVVTKFQGTQPPPAAPSKTRTKLNEPVNPAPLVNFQDIATNVAAFQGKAYKQAFPTPPATCP